MAENKYYGIYQGVVTTNGDNKPSLEDTYSSSVDTEKRGRIRVKCPDVLGADVESAWCDPMIPVAYDGGGDFCMPQVGETVWLMFIGGDANRPVWLGGWWQKKMTPIGGNYEDIDTFRIINYADCTITMKKGVININVGAGVCDLRIEHNLVTVKGNLKVEGNVSCYTLNAGDVNASQSVDPDTGATSGGHVKAEISVAVDGTTLNVP